MSIKDYYDQYMDGAKVFAGPSFTKTVDELQDFIDKELGGLSIEEIIAAVKEMYPERFI